MRAKKMKINELLLHPPPRFLLFYLNSMGQMSFWCYEKVPNQQMSMWQNFDLVMKFNLSHDIKTKWKA